MNEILLIFGSLVILMIPMIFFILRPPKESK